MFKESFHFSCAHFTIFDQFDRENLHGHDFRVKARLIGLVDSNGLMFDYNDLKQPLQQICSSLDESTLLPEQSPFLRFVPNDNYCEVFFGDERLLFLKRDVTLLPVRNISVEELGRWILDRLDTIKPLDRLPIEELVLSVSSGFSQQASVVWKAS